MRRIVAAVLFLLTSTCLLAAMDQTLINKLKQDRYFDHLTPPGPGKASWYHRLLVRSDRWRFGDLYGLCFLPQFKWQLEPFSKYPKKNRKTPTNRMLYIIGDSYLADKSVEGAFSGFDDVIFLDRRFPFGPITLDSAKQNYLIMEFAERNLVGYRIDKTFENLWTRNEMMAGANFRPAPRTDDQAYHLPGTPWQRLNNTVFNRNLSRNLELLLFDDRMFTPLKELKATVNYSLLNRVDKEVAISTDKSRLLMNLTVDTSSKLSAFRPLSAGALDSLVRNLNVAKDYYRSIGFKKVILAIVPNAVSVYDEKRMPYNHLLEKIEKRSGLPVVDIYQEFKRSRTNLYYRSDTHWNPQGFDLWVRVVNASTPLW